MDTGPGYKIAGIVPCIFAPTPEHDLLSSWDYNSSLPECSLGVLIRPCFCNSQLDEGGDNIYCSDMTSHQIQEVFSRDFGPKPNIRMISVRNVALWTLPADVFSDKQSTKLQFVCSNLEGLVIDAESFRRMNSTTEIHFQDCLFTSRSTYESLGYLKNLEILFFSGSYLANNISFPALPSLKNLYLFDTRMYSRFYLATPHPLDRLWVSGSDANTAELLLDSLRGSHLTSVRLTNCSLYRFSIHLPALEKLEVLELDNNPMVGIHQQPLLLHGGVNLTTLSLVGTGVKYLIGDIFPEESMASSHLALDNNTQLVTLAKETLFDLMVAMNQHGGRISLSGVQSLQCDCKVAWLVCVYNNYGHILSEAPGCADGSSVDQLNRADFAHCNEELCSSGGGPMFQIRLMLLTFLSTFYSFFFLL